MKTYHLKKSTDGWEIALEKSAETVIWGKTKSKAIAAFIAFTKGLSHPVSLRIHKVDGKFQEERTYPRSMDPRRSKG